MLLFQGEGVYLHNNRIALVTNKYLCIYTHNQIFKQCLKKRVVNCFQISIFANSIYIFIHP